MSESQEGERRRNSRHPVALHVVVQELYPPEADPASAVTIRGEIQNISGGGVCARLDQPCHLAALLRCEISVDGCPPSIPTLAYVRWIRGAPPGHIAGMEFLLRT